VQHSVLFRTLTYNCIIQHFVIPQKKHTHNDVLDSPLHVQFLEFLGQSIRLVWLRSLPLLRLRGGLSRCARRITICALIFVIIFPIIFHLCLCIIRCLLELPLLLPLCVLLRVLTRPSRGRLARGCCRRRCPSDDMSLR
jgi:hypothetical protein